MEGDTVRLQLKAEMQGFDSEEHQCGAHRHPATHLPVAADINNRQVLLVLMRSVQRYFGGQKERRQTAAHQLTHLRLTTSTTNQICLCLTWKIASASKRYQKLGVFGSWAGKTMLQISRRAQPGRAMGQMRRHFHSVWRGRAKLWANYRYLRSMQKRGLRRLPIFCRQSIVLDLSMELCWFHKKHWKDSAFQWALASKCKEILNDKQECPLFGPVLIWNKIYPR